MIGEEEKSAVMKVLDSGILSGFAAQPNKDFFGGPIIEKLETTTARNLIQILLQLLIQQPQVFMLL